MRRNFFIPLILIISLLFSSCNGCSSKQENISWFDTSNYGYDSYDDDETTTPVDDDGSVKIPYTEKYGNTITIPVKINGMGLDMIFDTGASSTCITLAEAKYLYGKGTLKDDDIFEQMQFQTADGSISVGLRINLREVIIGDKLQLQNVEALVVKNQQAPLLLGQSVMKLFREISVDRENGVVKFFIK